MRDAAPTVLIVDDEEVVRGLIARVLERQGHVCRTAADASEALRSMAEEEPELVLCDLTMPGISGLELASTIRSDYPNAAIVMVTGVDDPAFASASLEMGAFGYVIKPFRPNELLISVANALRRRRLELENRSYLEHLEDAVAERTSELRGAIDRLVSSEEKVKRAQEETIRRLALAVEFRDRETGEHVERMGAVCGLLARKLGLGEEQSELVRLASPLHDVGKIGIPDRILLKPGPLSTDEWVVMRTHAELGYRILSGSGEELLDLAATMAYTHHERMDGSGYPRGLAGEQIPIEGRITAVADVFDALVSDRVYQKAHTLDESLEILRQGRTGLFDPEVLDLFLESVDEVASLPAAPAALPS